MSIRDAYEMVSKSDAGCLRTLNEDIVRTVPDIGLLMVVDGMGGHDAGELAARIAADQVDKHMRTALAGMKADAPRVDEALRTALLGADRHIRSAGEANRMRHQMGATVACVVLHDNRAHLAHVGDTRIYRLRSGRLELLTRDDSPGQRALEAGIVDEDELAASHNRHLVTHALGAATADTIKVRAVPVESGDLLLVCSDGLNDMVDGADIELLLDTLSENLPLAAEQLVMVARDCGGHDNISVALVRIDAPFPARAPSAPVQRSGQGKSLYSRLRSWLTGAN